MVILIIVGIIVFLMMRKKKQEPAAQQAPETPTGPTPETQPQTQIQPAPALVSQPGAQPAQPPGTQPVAQAWALPADQAMTPTQDMYAQPGTQAEMPLHPLEERLQLISRKVQMGIDVDTFHDMQAQPGMDMTQAQQTGMQPVTCSVCGLPTTNYPGQGNWCATCQIYK